MLNAPYYSIYQDIKEKGIEKTTRSPVYWIHFMPWVTSDIMTVQRTKLCRTSLGTLAHKSHCAISHITQDKTVRCYRPAALVLYNRMGTRVKRCQGTVVQLTCHLPPPDNYEEHICCGRRAMKYATDTRCRAYLVLPVFPLWATYEPLVVFKARNGWLEAGRPLSVAWKILREGWTHLRREIRRQFRPKCAFHIC